VIRLLIAAAFIALPSAGLAQTIAPPTSYPTPGPHPTASPTPTPAPSPSPTAPTDICSSGISSLVSRPTQTNATCAVKQGHVLEESGYQLETVSVSRGGSYNLSSYPNTTLRIGTSAQNVEIDVVPPTLFRANGFSATSDVGLGARWQIGSTPTFAYGVNTVITAPTGSNPINNPYGLGSANQPTLVANANVEGSINSVLGYGATFSYQSLNAGMTHYTSIAPSLDVTVALPASWTLVFEGWRQTNGEGPATPSHTWFDAGVQKDIGNAQLDLNYGLSNRISTGAGLPTVQRTYVGAGLSYLF